MDEHEGKVFIAESNVGRLYVYWEEYKNNTFLHIRYWYLCKKEGIYKPSTKGIALPESRVAQLFPALRTAVSQRLAQVKAEEAAVAGAS